MLALQGAFSEHAAVLDALGAHPVEVRTPSDLAGVDALVLPGGESTTMSMLLVTSGLFDAISEQLAAGMPVLGTCAGLILLAEHVTDGRPDQRTFGVLDVAVQRNGYGRQRDSFETDLEIRGLGAGGSEGTFPAVFIRAPRITRVGAQVDVLASVGGDPVLVRQGPVVAAAFHPELSGDLRLHHLFLGGI
ncbi:MAG: pyridoxal 5'-phosphate synthase glutaminase subunit PdxT [Acidimicrobiales bacterium]